VVPVVERRSCLEGALRHAARFLPPHVNGAPFTYRNPLGVFEDRDFDSAVREAAQVYGAQPFLSEDAYHQALASEQFVAEDIEAVLALQPNSRVCAGWPERASLRLAMSTHRPRVFDAQTIRWSLDETDLLRRFRMDTTLPRKSNGARSEAVDVKELFEAVAERVCESPADSPALPRPRDAILAATGVDVDDVVLPFFVRLLRSYTGIGQRRPMRGRERGFLSAAQIWVAAEGSDSIPAGLRHLAALFDAQTVEKDDSLGVAVKCTEALGIPARFWNEFVRRKILALRGWAGLFACLQQFADAAGTTQAPTYRLIDYLAVYLTVTVAAIKNVAPNPAGWRFLPEREVDPSGARMVAVAEIFDVAQIMGLSPLDVRLLSDDDFARLRAEISLFDQFERRRVLHEAYERGRDRTTLRRLDRVRQSSVRNGARPLALIVFCADDKQYLFRQHIEGRCERFRTSGVQAFLGTSSDTADCGVGEKIDAVARFILLIGLVSNSPSLVVLVGHPKVSEDRVLDWSVHCGVCDGKCDVERAQRLASWANSSAVREGLRLRGVELPADTWFLAAHHSSQAHAIAVHNRNSVPELHLDALSKFEALLKEVTRIGGRSAHSRHIRLEHWPFVGKVLEKVAMMFGKCPDAGPASGHPGCTLCLIGFDRDIRTLPGRGAFLASYDAEGDPDGRLLAALIDELGPACSKVNLDYFFSRTDIDQFGVSTAHSTESGEMKDREADLRAGLPWSAVEAHEPLRLLIVVAAPADLVRRSLGASPRCAALVSRSWVRLASIQPQGATIFAPGELQDCGWNAF
jgi:uncharacterized protein YbcC (UPF0753/DUF2309 family)